MVLFACSWKVTLNNFKCIMLVMSIFIVLMCHGFVLGSLTTEAPKASRGEGYVAHLPSRLGDLRIWGAS